MPVQRVLVLGLSGWPWRCPMVPTGGGHAPEGRPASGSWASHAGPSAFSGVINFFSDKTLVEPGLFGIFLLTIFYT